MPWAVSHISAVLPLRRWTPSALDFRALVVGSMTPDLGWYINESDFAAFNHTLLGSIVAGLPVGCALLLVYYFFRRPVVYALPNPHRAALQPLCCPRSSLGWRKFLTILLSLLLGIWTHNFWDAFTHDDGWVVQRVHWLQQPVVTIQGTVFTLPFCLQVLSTIVGLIIVIAAYFIWLRRQPRHTSPNESDRWRYAFWISLGIVSLLVGVPIAMHAQSAKHGALFVKAFVIRTAVTTPDVFVPIALLVTSVVYARCRRA